MKNVTFRGSKPTYFQGVRTSQPQWSTPRFGVLSWATITLSQWSSSKGIDWRTVSAWSPPCLTGRLAWSHWMSLRPTFTILDRSDLRMLSKVARSGLSEQPAVRRRYSNFGMLRLFFSKTRASCEWTSDRRPKALFNWSILCGFLLVGQK